MILKMCFLNIGGNTKPTIKPPYNSCFNILADLVELRAVIINPFSQNYSATKSASILKQRNVIGNNTVRQK